MEITTGLFEHSVLQRNRRNRSEAGITGTAAADGTLFASVTQRGKPLNGWKCRRLGKVVRRRIKATLAGLPVGGPYDIELVVCAGSATVDRLSVKDVLVGDVWLVGGQSNMQGCGFVKHAPKPNAMVRAFRMSDQWCVAQDPIHNMWDCVDQVHIHLCGGVRPGEDKIRGLGPAVAFGQEMHRLTGIPQGLIASGHGGTSMAQWDPARKKEGGKSLYGAMIRRLTKNGGRAAGMIWYQGESDANPDCAKVYTERMKTLIRSVRRDTRSPKLPFALVQISRLVATWGSPGAWNSVQDQERRLQETVPAVVTVPAIDLTLEDLIHVGGPDVNRLGRRLGQAMAALLGVKGQKLPPALKSVSAKVSPLSGAVDLTVEYDNVQGALRAGSRPCGFDLVDANGTPYVYDILLEGNRAILRTSCALASLSDKALYYGYGYNPVCNITDEADRCLPVMGPISPSEHKRAIVPFVRKPQVSDLLPSAGRLGGLAYPNTSSLAWQTREFPTHFCNRHEELGKLAPEDRLVYYRCRIDVPDDMRLAVLLGYDGPVKLWVDGKELYHDPNGTNPAIEDQRSIPFSAKKGQHEVLVALASNNGKAWGVFLRFERLGVPKRLLEKGPESYAMPVVLGQ